MQIIQLHIRKLQQIEKQESVQTNDYFLPSIFTRFDIEMPPRWRSSLKILSHRPGRTLE